MNLKRSLAIMVAFSFLIQYYFMPLVMVDRVSNFTNNTGKFYMSVAMALCMGVLEVFMHDMALSLGTWHYYAGLIGLLVVVTSFYRKQKYITDKEYLKGMIEHHSMAVLTSKEIMMKSEDKHVKEFAKHVVKQQEAEINYMNRMLGKKVKKNRIK